MSKVLAPRGPDSIRKVEVPIPCFDDNTSSYFHSSLKFTFIASVLSIRGKQITFQPLQDSLGNVLCWNGEVFRGFGILVVLFFTHEISPPKKATPGDLQMYLQKLVMSTK